MRCRRKKGAPEHTDVPQTLQGQMSNEKEVNKEGCKLRHISTQGHSEESNFTVPVDNKIKTT
jgi:hypothetical protein